MKHLSEKLIIIAAAAAIMLSLASCSATDDIQRLGLGGWLNLGGRTDNTSLPVSDTPSPTAGLTETETPETVTTQQTAVTVLPVKPEIPGMEELFSGYDRIKPENSSVIMYISGTPSVYTVYGDTVRFQKNTISQMFGITPSEHITSAEALEQLLIKDEYFADLLYIPLSDALNYAENGLLAPIDGEMLSDGAYFEVSGAGTEESVYYLLPQSSAPFESGIMIYCNTDMLTRLGYSDDLRLLVKNGKWDAGAFLDALEFASGKDGISVLTGTFDREYTEAVVSLFSDENEAEKIMSFFTDSVDATADFYEGRSVFMISEVSSVRELCDSYDSYAVLPVPFVGTEGIYVSLYNPESLYVYAIPRMAVNPSAAVYYADITAYSAKYEYRYIFAESLYGIYLRQGSSAAYLGVNSMNGVVVSRGVISPEMPETAVATAVAQTAEKTGEAEDNE